jgi:HAD superfamily hydrolase (TIGR01458 family)
VGDQPIDGAIAALAELRRRAPGLRLVTNTTSRSRREVVERLARLGFEIDLEEVLTPAAMAVGYCREHGFRSVSLLVSDSLREDLTALEERAGERVDAVILGDLGNGFSEEVLNQAFRLLMDGAQLIALQHNRFWQRADGLVLDVGAYAAALEYACGRESVVVGKPAPTFFKAAMQDMGASHAVMVGDDIEADVYGAIQAGLGGVLVRTGKYREDVVASSLIEPTASADSIRDVPALLARLAQQ